MIERMDQDYEILTEPKENVEIYEGKFLKVNTVNFKKD